MFDTPMRILFAALMLVSLLVRGQSTCSTAAQFSYGCENFPPLYPVQVTRCYTFQTGGSSAYYNFLVTANCSNDVIYSLYNQECDVLIDQNISGVFSLIPNQVYVVCVDVACTSSGGIRAICPYEEFTLPIELLRFDARAAQDGVSVSWSTATEQNSWYFTLSRSNDTEHWSQEAQIQAAGNSQNTIRYQFVDHEPALGISYYKLESVDIDGSTRFIGVASAIMVSGGITSSIDPYDLIGRQVK